MNVSQDFSILQLILNASAVVQVVMAILIGVSFMSWYYIFMKWFAVRQSRRQTETFEKDFWSGGDLNNLYNSAVNDRHHAGSMERIFEAGFREFTKLKGQKNLDSKDVVDGSRRAMRATYQREMDRLESHLAFLASVGSVSPYIGLFGTVWGIMHKLCLPAPFICIQMGGNTCKRKPAGSRLRQRVWLIGAETGSKKLCWN